MRALALPLLVLGLACAAPAAAQKQQLRPGLWEHSMRTGQDGGQMAARMAQMQQQMAAMPPEQRKMVEQMMSRNNISVDARGTTVKVCMTREDVESDRIPQRAGCTQDVSRSGDTWKVSFQCSGDPPTSGEGTVRIASPTAYDGQFTMNTVVEGKPERVKMSQSGRWLGADCGAVKPATR